VVTKSRVGSGGPRFKRDPPRTTGDYNSQIFELSDGHRLGFDEYYVVGNEDMVVYLPNLAEGKDNPKSRSVSNFCHKTSKNFLVADWFGRGESTGKLMEATLSRWTNDTIDFLDAKTSKIKGGMDGKKAVLVGSGVGGWVAVLVTLKRPDLVRGIVGLSADPDFTEDLLWSKLPSEEKDAIMSEGFKEISWGGRNEVYPITSSLIEDGRDNLVLRGGPKSLKIDCPVRLIHSLDDEEVPYSVPLKLATCIDNDDVEVVFPKVGGHNLRDMTVRNSWIDPEMEQVPVSKFSTIQRALYTAIYQCLEATQPYDPEQLMW